MRWRAAVLAAVAVVIAAGVIGWIADASTVDRWLAVHAGTTDESSGYYAFWSGFGSDLAEFGLIGAVATGVYQVVRKYNCHQPRCWRVGNHPAAGGQFLLCYRHHPDYQGRKPTTELIARLHRDHQAHQIALHNQLQEIQRHLAGRFPDRAGAHVDSAPHDRAN